MFNEIYNVDCLNGMKELEKDSIDLVFTSPPYNMNLRIRDGKYVSRQLVKEISTKYKNFDDNLTVDEYYNFNRDVIDELLRVSGLVFYNVQFLTGNKRALFKLMGHYNEQLKEVIIWDKVNGQPAIQEGVMNSQYEVILVFDKRNAIARQFKEANFDRGTLTNLWSIKRGTKPSKNHGAVFPLELARKVVENFSKEGDVVLDPFIGIGTTAIACLELDRRYIGYEIDKTYYNEALKRIENTTNQTDIFDFI